MNINIYDIRRDNLERLIREKELQQRDFAAACKIPESYISQIRTRFVRNGKPISLGSKLARQIETACGKPAGWMDTSHEHDEKDNELVELYARMTDEMREVLLNHARLMVKLKKE